MKDKNSYILNNEEKDIEDFNEKVYEIICNFNNITGKRCRNKIKKRNR